VGNPGAIREVRQCLDDHGLNVLEVISLRLEAETHVEDFAPMLATGAELGARFVLLTSRDPDWSRGAANLAKVGELAAEYGIRPGLEFWRFSEIRSLQRAQEFILASGSEQVGLVVDALHLLRSGGTPKDVAAVPAKLHAFVQLCDATLEAPPEEALYAEALEGRFYPGQGELWLFDLLDALPADVPITLEAPCAANAHLPLGEQAKLAASATHAFLDAYQALPDVA